MLLGLAAAFVALVVLGGILQAIRTLIWDLSYFLPGWLITPILLLGLGLLAAVAVQVGWPWWQQLQQQKQPRSVRIVRSKGTRAKQFCNVSQHINRNVKDAAD